MIPKNVKGDFFKLRKARILSFTHLFSMLALVIMLIASTLFHPENNVPLLYLFALIGGLILYFKKKGNLIISGNLIAGVVFVALFPTTLETGGIYSDNLLWMVNTPLLALLLASRASGAFWLFVHMACTIYLYNLELNAAVSFKNQIIDYPPDYYLTSYLLLFAIVTLIVLIFANGQAKTIAILQEKQEVLERQKLEILMQANNLKKTQKRLKESNRELEQFAGAASHDLKEPLRMIGMYTKLIEKRLTNQLDDNTREFMGYVTDGVSRMQKLLTDLLEYSRVTYNQNNVKPTDLNEILFLVINNLTASMKETDTAIYISDLPTVRSSSTELTQLFQNLLSNSIKFRKKDITPQIHINHRIEGKQHLISVKDNSIGIAKEHQEKVFGIFERLHSKQDYEGSGIGLATCKKIVNKMGGKIWLNSTYGDGTTFYITVPQISN